MRAGKQLDTLSGLSLLALGGAAVALLSVVPAMPTPVKALAAGIFVLTGPGAAMLIWVKGLPTYVTWSLVPLVSVAFGILVTYLATLEGFWHPDWQMVGMTAIVGASAIFRGALRWPSAQEPPADGPPADGEVTSAPQFGEEPEPDRATEFEPR